MEEKNNKNFLSFKKVTGLWTIAINPHEENAFNTYYKNENKNRRRKNENENKKQKKAKANFVKGTRNSIHFLFKFPGYIRRFRIYFD